MGGTNTTLTVSLALPSGGAAGRVARIFHVQAEAKSWATSRIVTDASTYAREVQSHFVQNSPTIRTIPNDGFTFSIKFRPQWSSGQQSAVSGFPSLFEISHSANEKWFCYFNSPAGTLDFACRVGGVTYTATKNFAAITGDDYIVTCRACTSLGEHGLAPYTMSIFLDGAKGTDVVRSGNPNTAADPTAVLNIGQSSIGNCISANLRRIRVTHEILTDTEIAALV